MGSIHVIAFESVFLSFFFFFFGGGSSVCLSITYEVDSPTMFRLYVVIVDAEMPVFVSLVVRVTIVEGDTKPFCLLTNICSSKFRRVVANTDDARRKLLPTLDRRADLPKGFRGIIASLLRTVLCYEGRLWCH